MLKIIEKTIIKILLTITYYTNKINKNNISFLKILSTESNLLKLKE